MIVYHRICSKATLLYQRQRQRDATCLSARTTVKTLDSSRNGNVEDKWKEALYLQKENNTYFATSVDTIQN